MLYWGLIPVYIVIIILQIVVEKSPVVDVIGSLCYLSAMLIFAFFFMNYYKEYKYVDYSQPTLVMLKKAAYRYQPFQFRKLWRILLAVLLIDVGLGINASHSFKFVPEHAYFLGAIALAMLIGLLIWRVRYKPIGDASFFLIREITGEDKS